MMKTYLITYYYGQQTHHAYASSVSEAKAYAAELISYNTILPEDAMSIIHLPDQSVIYYKSSHVTLDSLYEQTSLINRFIGRAKSLFGRPKELTPIRQLASL